MHTFEGACIEKIMETDDKEGTTPILFVQLRMRADKCKDDKHVTLNAI
jgi:hypothetical protein